MLAITVGAGVKNPHGSYVRVEQPGVEPIAAILRDRAPQLEDWWSPFTWDGNTRATNKWRTAAGVAVDVDFSTPGAPPAQAVDQLEDLATSGAVHGSIFHLTPHGARVVFVFDAICTDRDQAVAAGRGAGALIARSIAGTGYQVDEPLLGDLARLFYTPNSIAKGVERHAEVLVLRSAPYTVAELAREAPAIAPPAAAPPPPRRTSPEFAASREEAIRRWNADHPGDWPRHSSRCPVCDDGASFGRLPNDETRWYCFSTDHPDGVGLRGEKGHHGDALDLKAHTRGCKPIDVLRADAYLPPLRTVPHASSGRPSDVGDSPPPPDDPQPSRPVIEITTEEKYVVDQAIEALKPCPDLYQRGGVLVDVVQDNSSLLEYLSGASPLRIRLMPSAKLREEMADSAEWVIERTNKKTGECYMSPAHPPLWAVNAAGARGRWDQLRRLEAIVEAPTLRPDGSVLDEPGYDVDTGLLFIPSAKFTRVADRPTRADALRARDDLLEVVCDFPLTGPEHRAAYLAALLTPFARFAIAGPAPMVLVDGNTRGCGKGLTVDTISVIATGRPMARMAYVRDDAELDKRITSIAISGEPLVLFDNVSGDLGGASLDAALTSTVWTGRILGKSELSPKTPLRTTFFATGNNVLLVADTARRVLHVRIETPDDKPEERAGFKHPNLLAWVKENRPRLVHAALTILRAYHVAGRPIVGLKAWGSYESWSSLIRAACVWVDMPDPGITRIELAKESDTETGALRALLAGIDLIDPRGVGVTAKAILGAASSGNDTEGLSEAISELCPTRDGKGPSPRALGKRLAHLRKRVLDGRYLDRKDQETEKGIAWFVGQARSVQ